MCCFIQPVINKFIARDFLWRNRVRSDGRNERLEPYVEKFTRTVLRGGDDGNIIPLTRPQVDQRANSKQATLENARIEGVAHRVEVLDGDMRQLPLLDASMDVVVASKSIHNIPDREGRFHALQEIVRVLTPGGRVALMDIFCTEEFAEDLQKLGMLQVTVEAATAFAYPPLRLVTARKKEAA